MHQLVVSGKGAIARRRELILCKKSELGNRTSIDRTLATHKAYHLSVGLQENQTKKEVCLPRTAIHGQLTATLSVYCRMLELT